MVWPTYSVEVAWDARLTGVFTIGTSTIGGTDLIGGTFSPATYDTITEDVKDIHIARGRQSDMEYMTQGKCTLRLKDPWGRFNPEGGLVIGNLVTNPSFEVDLTDWTIEDDAATIIGWARSTGWAQRGSASVAITDPTLIEDIPPRKPALYYQMSALSGLYYVLSFDVYTYMEYRVNVAYYLGGTWHIDDAVIHNGIYGDYSGYEYHRISIPLTIPPAVPLRFRFVFDENQTGTFYLDGVQLQAGTVDQGYVDGDQPHCSWSGTAHASTSIAASSELYGLLDVMKPVRVRAAYDGTTYDLFHGYISSIEYDPDRSQQEAVIEAVDFFEWLQMAKPTIAEQTSKTTDYLIGMILDSVGFTSHATRNLSASQHTVPTWSADGTATALSLIEDLLEVDRGVFFVARDGKATYIDHGTLYSSASVATITGAEAGSLRSRIDKDGVVNGMTVTKTGGVAQTYVDADSRRRRGYREGSSIDSAYLASDSQAMILAKWLVNLQKAPRAPARRVKLSNKDATSIEQILGRELGEVVTIDETTGNTNITGHLWQIEHKITATPRLHECWFAAQKRAVMFFTIGESVIGGTDVIGY